MNVTENELFVFLACGAMTFFAVVFVIWFYRAYNRKHKKKK